MLVYMVNFFGGIWHLIIASEKKSMSQSNLHMCICQRDRKMKI